MTLWSSSHKQFLETLVIVRAETSDHQLLPSNERTLPFCPRRHSRTYRSASEKLQQIKDAVKLLWWLLLQRPGASLFKDPLPLDTEWPPSSETAAYFAPQPHSLYLRHKLYRTKLSECTDYDIISHHCIWHNLDWKCWKLHHSWEDARSLLHCNWQLFHAFLSTQSSSVAFFQ